MSKLLYIESSPRKDRSASIEVANSFIQAFTQANPNHQVETIDLWNLTLPELNGELINAKYRILHGDDHSQAEAQAWREVEKITAKFMAADQYLFSIPMWNFSIPYKLKHYIDIVTQPSLTFSHSHQDGFKGLVTGKPATLIYARGGDYESIEASAMDFQQPYMDMILGFIGFEEINSVFIEPTLTNPEAKARVIAEAKERAIAFAGALA
ncbi:MAG: NAD(P)H-dependent oxidoreductase [Pseudomonadales bacterium]|nr:NAD(P)H-dependent oxidoreductase [Pseudomonadales bacterium]MCP5302749.1 NAD(P)H-dependent oxidoreductase [Pseudomonadales bacterium]